MASHLMKAPLTALIYAAILHFILVFVPYSQGYTDAMSAYPTPFMGYVFMIVYGLWLSIILAVVFGSAKSKGFKLMLLLLLPVLVTQCVVPMLQQILYGETTGTMTMMDSIMELARSAAAIIFIMLLAALLFKAKEPAQPAKSHAHAPPQVTYKIKKLDLAVKMLVLPIMYCVIYFLVWYFLLWRFEAVRVYYSGSAEHKSFIQESINMLLTNAKLVPLALLKGLLLALCLIPLLKELEAKRVLFIIVAVMLFLGSAVHMLIPNPVMPFDVRFPHLMELAADAVLYGALTGFLMHISLLRKVPQTVVTVKAAAAVKAKQAEYAVASPDDNPQVATAKKA